MEQYIGTAPFFYLSDRFIGISDRDCGKLIANLAYERMIPVRKKWMVPLCLALALLMSGCGTVKTAWVTGRFISALSRSPVTSVSGNGLLVLHSSTLGLEGTSGLTGEFTALSDPETKKFYGQAEGEVSALGLGVPAAVEFFGGLREDTVDYALKVKPPELWSRGSFSVDLSRILTEEPGELMKLLGQAAMSTELTTVEGEQDKAYCIALEVSPEKLLALRRPSMDINSMAPVKLRLLLRIQGKTYLPEELRLEATGLTGSALREIFGGEEEKGPRITDGEFLLTLGKFGYGPQKLPQVPKEGLEAAERLEELKQFFKNLFP